LFPFCRLSSLSFSGRSCFPSYFLLLFFPVPTPLDVVKIGSAPRLASSLRWASHTSPQTLHFPPLGSRGPKQGQFFVSPLPFLNLLFISLRTRRIIARKCVHLTGSPSESAYSLSPHHPFLLSPPIRFSREDALDHGTLSLVSFVAFPPAIFSKPGPT